MLNAISQKIHAILTSADMNERRPALKEHNESNVPGLFVIGDLAGAPVIKLAMSQGFEVTEYIASRPDARSLGARLDDSDTYDLIIAGAGRRG